MFVNLICVFSNWLFVVAISIQGQFFLQGSRTLAHLLLEQLFLVWEMRTRGGCSRGFWTGEQSAIWIWRGTFFESAFGALLITQNCDFRWKKCSEMEPAWNPLEAFFQRTLKIGKVCLDCAGVHGLYMTPSHIALRAAQKSIKHNDIFQNHSFKQQ